MVPSNMADKLGHPCPHAGCGAVLGSRYAFYLHRADCHGEYEDGKVVEEKTAAQLEKVGARVTWLLLNRPETRNPKNTMLWAEYLQRFSPSHILCYDVAHGGWMLNRPEGVLKAEDFRELFAELETARRRRQDLQLADKAMYHDPNSPVCGKLHRCILPSEKDQILADEKQEAMRRHYGMVGQSLLVRA